MSLIADWQKIDMGRQLNDATNRIKNDMDEVISFLNKMVAAKTTYPEAVVEIDGYITTVKTRCQNIISEY